MKKLFILLTITVSGFFFVHDNVNFSRENTMLENIEALASNDDDPVSIQSCYMNGDIISDAGAASSYTICNSKTTSSMTYKCGDDKRGNIRYSPFQINTYTCIK